MLLVSKILNSESNSQQSNWVLFAWVCCCWYQRYWILKAIHNSIMYCFHQSELLLVSKILNSESNSQRLNYSALKKHSCCWYQRYWILKAIHNGFGCWQSFVWVVVGIKDTEFWKQFTTATFSLSPTLQLLLVSKILNSESNSQLNP